MHRQIEIIKSETKAFLFSLPTYTGISFHLLIIVPQMYLVQCVKSPHLLREKSSQEDQKPISPCPAPEPCSWANWKRTDFEPTALRWFDIHHCTPQMKTNTRCSFQFNIIDSGHLDLGEKLSILCLLIKSMKPVNMNNFPYSLGKQGTALPYFSKIKFIWNATVFLQKDRFQSIRHLTLNSMQNGLLLHTFLKSSSLYCVCR